MSVTCFLKVTSVDDSHHKFLQNLSFLASDCLLMLYLLTYRKNPGKISSFFAKYCLVKFRISNSDIETEIFLEIVFFSHIDGIQSNLKAVSILDWANGQFPFYALQEKISQIFHRLKPSQILHHLNPSRTQKQVNNMLLFAINLILYFFIYYYYRGVG